MTYKSIKDQLILNSDMISAPCWEWKSYRNKRGYGTVKVNVADVLEIRSSTFPTKMLANKFNISESNVNLIKAKKTWAHI